MFNKMTRSLPTPGATLQGMYPAISPPTGKQLVEPMVIVCKKGNPKFDPAIINVGGNPGDG
jgi:hypothetical protein